MGLVAGPLHICERSPVRVLRAISLVGAMVWLVGSATRGGLRQAVFDAWTGVRTRGQAPPGQPDARSQWSGLYYNAVDALEHLPLARKSTVAVVLLPSDRVTEDSSPKRFYETVYRLYPTRVEFYFRSPGGGYHVSWFRSPRDQVPRVPALWRHDYVVWADANLPPTPTRYQLIYGNSEARVYRREGG